MSERTQTDDLPFRYPSVGRPHDTGPVSEFLTYLAFEGHAIRVGLELSACVVLFQLLLHTVPWATFGVVKQWSAISAWFSACFLVLLVDQLVLFRAVYTFRRAYQLSLSGAYEAALLALERIAPDQKILVKCPTRMFHMLRAEILINSETYRSAEREIELAEQAGAKGEQLSIVRSRLLRSEAAENAFTKAEEELDAAKKRFGDTAILALEHAQLQIEEHKNLWDAKRTLRRVSEMPDEMHFSGDVTSQLANALLNAARLWTGEAEEGLDGLNIAIERLRSLASAIDTLRPILALLHLERSLYLATHKEPELACFDLRIGLALCNSPRLRAKADKIQDELAWRYKIFASA